MNSLQKIWAKITGNVILRNVILAVCAVIVFLFLVSILLNFFTRHNKYERVPDFSGLSMEKAQQAARDGRLVIEINDSLYMPMYEGGVILDQLPKPGTQVKKGRRIFVTTNSYHQKTVRIPYVTGYSLRQAKNNLEVAGLEIDRLIFREDPATYNVLEQRFGNTVIRPDSYLDAEQGSGITLVVGLSPDSDRPAMPKIVGLTLRDAKSRIWEAGLNVGELVFDPDVTPLTQNEARVYSQNPEQGSSAGHGASVTMRLTLDEEKTYLGSQASDRAARRLIEEREAERLRHEEESAAIENAVMESIRQPE